MQIEIDIAITKIIHILFMFIKFHASEAESSFSDINPMNNYYCHKIILLNCLTMENAS